MPAPTTALELTFEAVPDAEGGWELRTGRRADGVGDGLATALVDGCTRRWRSWRPWGRTGAPSPRGS
ncbi:hypothetical protein NKH77_55015 [Streptomyces sp. M19]